LFHQNNVTLARQWNHCYSAGVAQDGFLCDFAIRQFNLLRHKLDVPLTMDDRFFQNLDRHGRFFPQI
jgi:hypothetical protein